MQKKEFKITTLRILKVCVCIILITMLYYYIVPGWAFTLPSIPSITTNIVGDYLSDHLRNYISDTVLDGAISWASSLYNEGVNSCLHFMFEDFRPDVQIFLTYTGDSSVFLEAFTTLGYTLSIFIFTYMIMISASKALNLSDTKDTPLRLIGMFSVSLFCIYFHEYIENMIYTIANDAWNFILTYDTSAADLAGSIADIAIPDSFVEGLVSSGSQTLMVLLSLIFGIIFFIQYIKLAVEIIERYLIACFLKYLFSIAVATITSKNTLQIFKKYFQMLVCQLLLLIFNLIFVKMIANMIAVVLSTNTFTSWMMLFGMMKIAQRMDFYMRCMGMSVAITGGGLLDAVSLAGGSLLRMGRAAQLGGGLAGATLTRLGASSGNLGLLRAGNALNNLTNPIRSAGGRHGMSQVLSTARMRGDIDSVSSKIRPDDIDNSLVDLARSRGMDCLELNGMPLDTKAALMEQAYGSSLFPADASFSDIRWNKFGDIGGSFTDGSGNTAAFTLSPTPTNDSIRTIDTENGQLYMTARGSLQPGQSCSYNYDPDNPEALTFAECISGKSFDSLGESRGDIDYIVGGQDGNVLLKDREGTSLANLDTHGNWDYNVSSIGLSEESLSSLSQFKDFDGLAVQNNGDGSYTVLGKRIINQGTQGVTEDIQQFSLYNRALYPSRDSVPITPNSRYVTGFGKNDIEHGSYHVFKNQIREKDSAQMNILYERIRNGN